jgi:serine/threonine-protein kinase RsbT
LTPSAPREAELAIRAPEDVLWARQEALRFVGGLPWRPENLARIEVIVAELASNMCKHAGGGRLRLRLLEEGDRRGVRVVAVDEGPGIPDVARAMASGYSTTGTYGEGLATIREFADACRIESTPGAGTRVEVEKWAP